MIYEFAVDPALVIDWAIAGAGRWVKAFGLDQRRLVSDFPRDWKGRVVGLLYEKFGYDDSSVDFQNAQPVVDAYLQLLTDCMVSREITFPVDADWLIEAIREHSTRPFYSILAADRPAAAPQQLILESDCDNIRDERWHLPTIGTVRKSAKEIAAAISPILRSARQICIVDPYFDASEQRFRDTFSEIVSQSLAVPRAIQVAPEILLLTSLERAFNSYEARDAKAEAGVARFILANAQRHLSAGPRTG